MSTPPEAAGEERFLKSLTDGSLYSMGAYFSDRHPDLIDEVVAQSVAIEEQGLRLYATEHGVSVQECYETLMTGLAIRYFKAVAG